MLKMIKQLFQRLFFTKADVIIRINKRRAVDNADLIQFDAEDVRAAKTSRYPELNTTTASQFIIQILILYKSIVARCLSLSCLRLLCTLLAPVLIHFLLSILSNGTHYSSQLREAIELAILFSIVSIVGGIIINQCFFYDFTVFQMYQRLLNTAIYKKILSFQNDFQNKLNISNLVNLIGNDTHYLSNLGFIVNDLFFIIILFAGIIGLLFFYLHQAAIITVLSILIFNPLAYLIMKSFGKSDLDQSALREERIASLSQIIKGILTIKLFSLEKKTIEEVEEIRKKEFQALKKRAYLSAFSFMIFGSVTSFISFCSFVGYYALYGSLDSATVFTALSLIILLEVPLSQLSDVISDSSSAYIAAKRILSFLKKEEMSLSSDAQLPNFVGKVSHCSFGINVKNFTLTNILKDISLEIQPGEATVILGEVGSGKSCLLHCLLGEIPSEGLGSLHYFSDLADEVSKPIIGYLSQEPFIINGTIRENILLGKHISTEELSEALYLCALDKDILQFSDGLETRLGENGINLSGGQRQRLNLCRILLSKPGILLLDDPFSAVDNQTKSFLMQRLLLSEWKFKTRVIATNSLDGLEYFDNIVYLVDGKVTAKGKLEVLLENPEFQNYYKRHQGHTQQINVLNNSMAISSVGDNVLFEATQLLGTNENYLDKNRKTKAYQTYVKAMCGKPGKSAYLVCFTLIFLVFMTTTAPIVQNVWLAIWTNSTDMVHMNLANISMLDRFRSDNLLSLGIYGGLILLSALITFCQRALWFRQAAVASQVMHDRALKKIMSATLRFFDTTPAGVILSVFLRDLTIIERDLKWTFENMARVSVQIVVTLIFMVVSIPFIMVLIGPLLFLYYLTQRKFRKISREVKWLAQTNQAFLNTHIKETFENLVTIRALGKTRYFEDKFFERQKIFQESAYTQEIIDRWFSTRVPLISGIISFVVSIAAVIATYYGMLSAGIAGLTFTYLIGFWTQLNWSVRSAALVEGNIASIERLNCLASLPEESETCQSDELFDMSKIKGKIEFRDVSVKYAKHLPTILKNISFSLESGTSLGVVGRTGSGKSTLIQAILRFCDVEGEILIDGVNITKIPISALREIVAVIPQTPFIFSGTVRENLDPFKLHTDVEVYNTLEKIGFLNINDRFLDSGELDMKIDNDGQNFSQGQKQLLCIARALLRHPKIVIMDEITANLDRNTDLLIHKTLNTVWEGVTKIIISHRPTGIVFCDQIIRLENGFSQLSSLKSCI